MKFVEKNVLISESDAKEIYGFNTFVLHGQFVIMLFSNYSMNKYLIPFASGCKIRRRHLYAGVIPNQNKCPEYDTKLSNSEAPVLELWRMGSTPSLPLLPSPLWPGVAVTVRVPSIAKIKRFNHSLYMKPFNCVQTND